MTQLSNSSRSGSLSAPNHLIELIFSSSPSDSDRTSLWSQQFFCLLVKEKVLTISMHPYISAVNKHCSDLHGSAFQSRNPAEARLVQTDLTVRSHLRVLQILRKQYLQVCTKIKAIPELSCGLTASRADDDRSRDVLRSPEKSLG